MLFKHFQHCHVYFQNISNMENLFKKIIGIILLSLEVLYVYIWIVSEYLGVRTKAYPR